jgi:Sideroflexins
VIYRTLLVSKDGLEQAKSLIASYKLGKIMDMTPDLWQAKKVVDSTLHPGAYEMAEGTLDANWKQIPENPSFSRFACHASSCQTWL